MKSSNSIPKVVTGIAGLDDALEGGFPQGTVCVISGGPGCGKTILASEYLYKGITEFDEPGIYVSLGESREEFYNNTISFGWDFAALEKQGKFMFIDFSFEKLVNIWLPGGGMDTENMKPVENYPDMDGMSVEEQTYIMMMQNFINTIVECIRTLGAKRVVIDPISSLRLIFPSEFISRREFLRIFTVVRETKATTLVLTELPKEEGFSVEEFVASGVIRLSYSKDYDVLRMTRKLVIYKMRGTRFNEKVLSMRIASTGIELMGETLGLE